jgi:flagellar biosynthesis/type III secretory pathway M-ring protein FliF/YscJ
MTANSVWTWLKKFGLWILAGLAVLLWLISKLIPTVKGKPEILQKAKEQATAAKTGATEEIKKLDEKMEGNRKELEEIKAIKDEEERLKRLAEFANKR